MSVLNSVKHHGPKVFIQMFLNLEAIFSHIQQCCIIYCSTIKTLIFFPVGDNLLMLHSQAKLR